MSGPDLSVFGRGAGAESEDLQLHLGWRKTPEALASHCTLPGWVWPLWVGGGEGGVKPVGPHSSIGQNRGGNVCFLPNAPLHLFIYFRGFVAVLGLQGADVLLRLLAAISPPKKKQNKKKPDTSRKLGCFAAASQDCGSVWAQVVPRAAAPPSAPPPPLRSGVRGPSARFAGTRGRNGRVHRMGVGCILSVLL